MRDDTTLEETPTRELWVRLPRRVRLVRVVSRSPLCHQDHHLHVGEWVSWASPIQSGGDYFSKVHSL